MSNQSLRQALIRALTGTEGTYNEDWIALFDLAGIPDGSFNERLFLWLEQETGLSGLSLPELMVAYAVLQGVATWNELGQLVLDGSVTGTGTLVAQAAVIVGAGSVTGIITGTGVLAAQSSAIVASGSADVLDAPVIDILPQSDRGADDEDDISNETEPQFSIDLDVNTMAGDILHVYMDSGAGYAEVGTGTSITAGILAGTDPVFLGGSPLTDDTYDIKMTVENGNGESADSNIITYVLDTSIGAASLALAAGGLTTDDTTPTMRVTCAGGLAGDISYVNRASDGFSLGTKVWDGTDETNGFTDITLSTLTEDDHLLDAGVYGTASGSGAGTFSENAQETLTITGAVTGTGVLAAQAAVVAGAGTVAGAGAITGAFIDSYVDSGNKTTFDFLSVDFGAADADRIIVVGVGAYDGGSDMAPMVSVTIGGITATVAVQASVINGFGNQAIAALYAAAVPTGTSGTVSVVFTAAGGGCGIGVYRLLGADGVAASDTASDIATPYSQTVTVPDGGYVIGVGFTNASTTTHTWGNLTETYDEDVDGTTRIHTGASEAFVTGGDTVFTMTPAAVTDTRHLAVWAAWAPA